MGRRLSNKRLIAIGDIHGEITKLNNLIEKLTLQNNDKLIFLGDYIDRGQGSKQVVDKLIELSKSYECEFLMGNHEFALLEMFKGSSYFKNFFFDNGGTVTTDSYGGSYRNIMKIHGKFYKNLKMYYKTDKYLFVHAGIRPDKALERQEKEDFLWIRDNFIYKKHQLKQKVIFGHTAFEKPFIENDRIGIDTGCGKYDYCKLTAFICDEEKFIQSDY